MNLHLVRSTKPFISTWSVIPVLAFGWGLKFECTCGASEYEAGEKIFLLQNLTAFLKADNCFRFYKVFLQITRPIMIYGSEQAGLLQKKRDGNMESYEMMSLR